MTAPDGGRADVDSGRSDGAVAGCIPRPAPDDGLHVTVDGTASGDGSMGAPWDLATALGGGVDVPAGATVWVHGGTYAGTFSARLQGTAEAPIVVRAYPGERATLDGAGSRDPVLGVDSDYTWYWGLEMMNSDTGNRETDVVPPDLNRGDGVAIAGSSTDVRFINLAVHDASQGISFWTSAVDSEVYGCLVSLNGIDAPDRPHGHAIYTQNMDGNQAHRGELALPRVQLRRARLHGGRRHPGLRLHRQRVLSDGHTDERTARRRARLPGRWAASGGAHPGRVELRLQHRARPRDLPARLQRGERGRCRHRQLHRREHRLRGAVVERRDARQHVRRHGLGSVDPADYPDNTYLTAPPTETRVFVRTNRYEPGRAHIIVYDWGGRGTIEADVSEAIEPGMAYEVRNATDFFGPPVATGVYDGSSLSLSLDGLEPAQPVGIPDGIQPDERSTPTFAVFVLLRTDSRSTIWP